MRFLKKHRFPAFLLLVSILLGTGIIFQYVSASAADEQEDALLGTLSQRYEAGSPGTISSGSGDAGGKSYGAYQFASVWDVPKDFFQWCQDSKNTYYRSIGSRLSDAYEQDKNAYGSHFDKTWQALAKENRDGFLQAQRNYVRLSYYDPIVRKVEAQIRGFHMDNYSIALRNVFWSRSVQHGASSAADLVVDAFHALGGFRNQPESELINAIYAESGKIRPATSDDKYVMSGTDAQKYGVDNHVLQYYRGNSGDVQLGVYLRLRVNEPAAAQLMLSEYGYVDAPLDEGAYQLAPSQNSKLAAMGSGSSVTLKKRDSSAAQDFHLTYFASGYYTIDHVASGKRLSASSSGKIVLAKPSTTTRQLWRLNSMNSGFSLKNRSTGQYLSIASTAVGSRLIPSDTATQWQMLSGAAQWSLTNGSYPTYASTLQVGSSGFSFGGVLRSTHPIKTVKVAVLNSQGNNAFPPAVATKVGSKVYNLSKLDGSVAISTLSADKYTLVITATNTASSGTKFRLESPFFVSDRTYTLTFDARGGTCSETKRKVEAGQAYGELPRPKKSGYTFKGWYTAKSGGKKVDANTIAAADNTTLYARYSKLYTYQFVNYDGTVIDSGRLVKGKKIPCPDTKPSRPSSKTRYYVFTGWTGYTEGMTISKSVTFEAAYNSKPLSHVKKITSSTYRIRKGYLSAIPEHTSKKKLLNGLAPRKQITIEPGTSKGGKYAATGMKAVYRVKGKTMQTLTVVVSGDLNGDGKISLTDMVQLQNYLQGRGKLNRAASRAADVNGDGKLTLTDMVQIQRHLLGKGHIKPR